METINPNKINFARLRLLSLLFVLLIKSLIASGQTIRTSIDQELLCPVDTTFFNVRVTNPLEGMMLNVYGIHDGEIQFEDQQIDLTEEILQEMPDSILWMAFPVIAIDTSRWGEDFFIAAEIFWPIPEGAGERKIIGYKFHDLNGNGSWEGHPPLPGEEPGLPDVEIRLSGPEGEKKTKTDKNGRFEFAVTKPGTYTVSEQIPSGWAPTTPSSFDINIGDFDHVTVPEILFGNEVTPSKCIAFHEVKKGRGMGIRILEPNNPEVTSKENEPIPLVVHSSDQDLVYHYCECKGEGIAWDTIEIVDMIDYDWLILSESLLSGKTLTNGGKVSVNKGPGIFFIPPEIELGETYKCQIKVEVSDSRFNDIRPEAIFDITIVREEDCKYKQTIIAVPTAKEDPIELPTGRNEDCVPNGHNWRALRGFNTSTARVVHACVGELLQLKATGSDDLDELNMLCAGECGESADRALLFDALDYTWQVVDGEGKFVGYGNRAKTNGRHTTVVYQVGNAPGTDTIVIATQDSRKQGPDGPDKDTIILEIGHVDLVVEDLKEEDEECEGARLCLNNDDDNKNEIPDLDNGEKSVKDEDDLLKVKLMVNPEKGNITLSAKKGGDKIKVWEESNKENEIKLPKTYPANKLPEEVWVEGIKESTIEKDVELVLKGNKCQDIINLTISCVDLDMDTNMDGNPDNDEKIEMRKRAIIVDVNNDSDKAGDAIDNQDDLINGVVDKAELSPLLIRKIAFLPKGENVTLKVSDNTKLRIFDDEDKARIGTVDFGGPNDTEYQIPKAKITKEDLKYLVEGLEHGHVNILLLLKNIKGEIICSDTVRAVINVDRLPGDGFKTLRNRINASKNKPNLEGIEAKLEGEKPLITWGKPRKTTTTSYWISLQDYGGATGFNGWLQTGVRVIKRSNGTESEEHYFEFVPNYNGYNLPPGDPDFDRDGYQIFQKRGGAWKGGKFKVEITDKPNDKVEVFFDDNSWKSAVHADISTLDFENYQIGTEPKQSVARNPGSSARKSKVSGVRLKDNNGWGNANLVQGDLSITWVNGKGVKNTRVAGPNATLVEFSCKWLDSQSFEMWDGRDW